MSSSNIKVDFVLLFDPNHSPSKTSNTSNSDDLIQEYEKLITRLRHAGLEVTSRMGRGWDGKKGKKGEIMIFVRASEERVQGEVQRERISDWLHGITSTRDDPHSRRDFTKDPVTSAERIRQLHSIITHSTTSSQSPFSNSAGAHPSAGVLPHSSEFPHLTGMFPPHDLEFNKNWLLDWTSGRLDLKKLLSIPESDLIKIKNHFGESVALYFEFLRHYFASLIFPSIFGILIWFMGWQFSSLYSTFIILWSLTFVTSWRIRESSLSVKWGVRNCTSVESKRTNFKPDFTRKDPVTDEDEEICRPMKREVRILASLPALVGFAAILGALITMIYTIEVVLSEVYQGPGKTYLTLLPTILFVGLVPQVVGVWESTALSFTEWENHFHQTSFEKSMTLKMFALNFLVAYGQLFLTSFVYIPFANVLIPRIISLVHLTSNTVDQKSLPPAAFSINSERITNQVYAYTATNQAVNFFLEAVVPFVTRVTSNKAKQLTSGNNNKGKNGVNHQNEDEDSERFLERMRNEAALPEYSLFVDYSEMVTQFGYIVLWSTIWPLAPFWSWVNNFVELRSDAFKICVNSRRPIPTRTDTIGPWLEALSFLTWIGALTNSALVYLFRPHSPDSNQGLASFLQPSMNSTAPEINSTTTLSPRALSYIKSNIFRTSQTSSPVSSTTSLLWSALLVALASEHAFFLAKWTIQYVMEQALWIGGEAQIALRKNSVLLKRSYLDAAGLNKDVELMSGKQKVDDPTLIRLKRDVEGDDGHDNLFWSGPDEGTLALKSGDKTD